MPFCNLLICVPFGVWMAVIVASVEGVIASMPVKSVLTCILQQFTMYPVSSVIRATMLAFFMWFTVPAGTSQVNLLVYTSPPLMLAGEKSDYTRLPNEEDYTFSGT